MLNMQLKTNYSRHLEEIAREAERLTLTMAQDFLMDQQLNKAVYLLEYWEEYLNIFDTSTLTMEEEMQLFTRKLTKLEGLLKELYMRCNTSEEGNATLELLKRCSTISQSVNQDKSLSAGGRFEWVDSVLVKCLQEGSWLLVDNVNLCSAAVLDRLNGLLEPNGVLTVSERGVDENGKMFVVEPHKDFRIFLTMDPKNGEISRAMRNRGVEIYMLNGSEITTDNSFDIQSLIDLEGLSDTKLIKSLLKVHDFISSLILSEKPKLSDILQCSSLISQQMRHGINAEEAFCIACVEIYFKPRNCSEFNCNNVLEIMQEGIKRCLRCVEQNDDLFSKPITLNTRCLAKWSGLEKVKHQASVCNKAADLFGNITPTASTTAKQVPEFISRLNKSDQAKAKKDVSIWIDIEKVKVQNEFVEKTNLYMLANLLAINFSLTSKNDVDCRVLYLQTVLKQPQWLGALERFNKVVEMFMCADPNLPHDDMWIKSHGPNESTCNAINYALQVEVYSFSDSLQGSLSAKNSLYNYLLAVKKKEVPDSFNNPICTNYLDLRTNHFRFMKKLVANFTTENPHLEKDLFKLLELLSWHLALHGFLTCVCLPQGRLKGPAALETKMDMLALYYKWFHKYSVKGVAQICNIEIPQPLSTILNDINGKIAEQFSSTFKIASNYKKLNSVPDFYTSEKQLEALDLIQTYDMFDPRNDPKSIISLFRTNPEYRKLLTSLSLHLRSDISLTQKLSFLKEFNVHTPAKDLKLQELQLLPLIDALLQLVLLQAIKSGVSMDLSSINHHILLNLGLSGVLMAYQETADERLLHEIKKGFYSTAANSPTARPNKIINGTDNTEIGHSIAGAEPAFLKTITQLLVSLENKCATLGEYRDVERQRHYLRALLWDNMHALCDEKFDFVAAQKDILVREVRSFFDKLARALNVPAKDSLHFSCEQIEDGTLKAVVKNIQTQYENLTKNFSQIEEQDAALGYIADIHVNVSFAELYLNSLLPRVDPLAKKAMKKNHLKSVLSMFEQMQKSFELQSSVFSNESGCIHPYYDTIRGLIADLKERVTKYGDSTNAGVKSYAYSYVVQQIKYASRNVFKTSTLDDINSCSELLNSIKYSGWSEAVKDKIQRLIDIFQSNIPSYDKVFQDWKQYRTSYPDIVEPLLANVAQFIYGFKLKVFWIKRQFVRLMHNTQFKVDMERELLRLVALPSLNKDVPDLNVLVDCYTLQRTGPFASYILCPEQASYVKDEANVRLLKCQIQETFNQCLVDAKSSRGFGEDSLSKFNKLVDVFIDMWNNQEETKKREKAEAESLYQTRTLGEVPSEEEQLDEDLNELFPNHHLVDFADFQENELAHNTTLTGTLQTTLLNEITKEDFKFVVELHSKLYRNFIRTEWLRPELNKNVQVDYVNPLMEKYKLVRRLMESHPHYFQYKLDSELCASLAVLLEVSTKHGPINDLAWEPSSPKTLLKHSKDFYKDPDIEEVSSCLPVLDNLKMKVKELLQEWPDQPTLNSILTVIERVLNFDIKSPISRYLTGLDILLSKCHEWEQVAHSGVSLINETPELIQKIIEWRKMELNRWKELLNTTHDDLTKPLNNWWLYLYNLLNQFISGAEMSETELVDTLQKFITKSPIVEFQGRLELLLEFHCRAVALPKTPIAEVFVNILWNIYNYFNQFSAIIVNKVKDLRSPIERKLRDYVKIARWKDVNYWAVKDTVEKTHKALHKFVREYKDLLLQPVTPHLSCQASDSLVESVGIWDRPQRQNPKAYHYTLDAESYIAKASLKDSPYLSKARKLCKETITGTDYPNLVKSLDAFVTNVIETSLHLKKLEVDTSLTKEKQKSQAKNILQQKHRALADLYQALSKIGVSYKTGIAERKLKNPAEEFKMEPIDLTACFATVGQQRMVLDNKILIIWDSCELYYYRSLLRHDVLDAALLTPAQDLGIHNIERCRGFAAHLMGFCQDQKKSLVKSTRYHYVLRNYNRLLHETCNNASFITVTALEDIKNIIGAVSVTISQVQLILNSCPPNESSIDTSFLEIPLLEPGKKVLKRKEDGHWDNAKKLVININSLLNKLQTQTQKADTDKKLLAIGFIPFANKERFFEDFQNLIGQLEDLQQVLEPLKVVDTLNWLVCSIKTIISHLPSSHEVTVPQKVYQDLLDKLKNSLLMVIQNLYKKYRGLGTSSKHGSEIDLSEEESPLLEGHLKVLLNGNLRADLAVVESGSVFDNTERLLKALLGDLSYASEIMRKETAHLLPLFDQVLHLSQYFITQQVAAYRTTCKLTSILLNIFIDLASKGFCVPPEFSDELDKEGVSKPSDGMGLGEGEGERDVSDKIESEDQLDDAQPAGQEKDNQDDPDCKEEDNGIEMSEDFDSKLQDKKPPDEDEEGSGDSDAEEQIGETEKNADQLDQEIWGDDKEEKDGDEGNDQTEEEGTGGERDGDDQLDAKDDSKKKPKNDEPSQNGKDESELNRKEINEMNEPEFDDEQVDPYHGNQSELPEPEPMDLPDDLQLDEGEAKDGEQPEENPFDIDEMKEQNIPEDQAEQPQSPKQKENDEEKDFSSDDEDVQKRKEDDVREAEIEDHSEKENIEEPSNPQGEQDNEEAPGDVENDESALDQNPSNQENVEAMEVDEAEASDKTQATQSENLKSDKPIEESMQEDKPDKEGVGQSQMEESESGHSVQANISQDIQKSAQKREQEKKRKERPGQSDIKRSLGDVNQPVEKKLKAMEADECDRPEQQEAEESNADLYQHIKEATEERSSQILDTATKEQAEEQLKEIGHKDDAEENEETHEEDGPPNLPSDNQEEMDIDNTDNKDQQSLKHDVTKDKSKRSKQHPEGDIIEEIQDVEIEGDIVETSTVLRPAESLHYTHFHLLQENSVQKLTQDEINTIRSQVDHELSSWKSRPTSTQAEQAWQKISSMTSNLAQDLSEQLRLVLEPTQASQLRGDFRTGRRINMRKIIPYIASQFRKDKIWLRRTKPSKREYQIVLAIDDSSSMAKNHSKELAFESVALISKALSLLESGQLAVVGFGENTEILHKLNEPFTDKSGVELLQRFQFGQEKTKIGKLMDFVTEMFEQNNVRTAAPNAKLLLIVSDGRGVFSEGQNYVCQAVRRVKLSNVFTVFVIIDNPENKDSVLDIRSTIFTKDGKLAAVRSYMDEFPFPFYIILRDINTLPGVLSDALMQWFEMVTSEQ